MKNQFGIGLLLPAFASASLLKASESGECTQSLNGNGNPPRIEKPRRLTNKCKISLPDLKPGALVSTSDATVKAGTVVKLISPTGYGVAEIQ